jgi:hypothetical protein
MLCSEERKHGVRSDISRYWPSYNACAYTITRSQFQKTIMNEDMPNEFAMYE